MHRTAHGMLIPWPGIQPVSPLQWLPRVLTTGSPENSLSCSFFVVQSLSHVELFATLWAVCSMPGFLVFHYLPESTQTHGHWIGDDILCCPLLLPSIFPNITVFSSVGSSHQEAIYWSFSISPSNEYSGLISFRIDWFDLLVLQGTL